MLIHEKRVIPIKANDVEALPSLSFFFFFFLICMAIFITSLMIGRGVQTDGHYMLPITCLYTVVTHSCMEFTS